MIDEMNERCGPVVAVEAQRTLCGRGVEVNYRGVEAKGGCPLLTVEAALIASFVLLIVQTDQLSHDGVSELAACRG